MKSLLSPYKFLLFAVVLLGAGCSLEKKSALNRGLQNLTAHYNILFNANEILREKQEAYAASYVDDYSELLGVYQDTIARADAPDKDLTEVKAKANKIISLKEQSNYIGNAYLLLAKANYFDRNFFDVVEYANYVIGSFSNKPDLKQEALVWKARALLYLHQPADAKVALDSALRNINPKKDITADVYATRLQYDINVQDYEEGEEMAKQAVATANTKLQRMRLTFILAQLQELNHKQADAVENYLRIETSNVAFEMAFNATLNRIRIEDMQNGVKISRVDRLRSLLRNQNNTDFTDQIYYQIAQLQYADHDMDAAIKSYHLSASKSTKNQNQKGLAYLRLADLYFKDKADYKNAKMYYDSTLLNLSPNYPGYATIRKKSDNLQLLSERLEVIAREDTLQMLAGLDESTRTARIDAMVNAQILARQSSSVAPSAQGTLANAGDPSAPQASVPNGDNFYFYNAKAVSQGFNDFKRRWGNRRLEDNWRRSNRGASDLTTNTLNTTKNVDPDAVPAITQADPNEVDAANYRQGIVQNLPLTPALMAQSNKRVFDAYMDIANFYRDVLGDKKEAAATYERLLARFPDNDSKPALYYNLYRLYSDDNKPLSDKYRELLVKNYPETPFAKAILDPEFNRHSGDEDAGFTTLYNKVYDFYANKQYPQVISAVDALLAQYPTNRLAAQLYYLRAFAAGHQEQLTPFNTDLQAIVTKYPEDKLITPLVNQHLTYIAANQAELAARPIVITDRDDLSFSIPIVYQQQTEYRAPSVGRVEIVPDVRKSEPKPETPKVAVTKPAETPKQEPQKVAVEKPAEKPKPEPQKIAVEKPAEKPAVTEPVETKPAEPPLAAATQARAPQTAPSTDPDIKPVAPEPSIFNMRDSTNYYFAVSVNSGTTNLASSRFGIGQFNRVNFERSSINHQLKNAGSNAQIIYVGRFSSLESVKNYARAIAPLMPDIMKVPRDKYRFFIITKENLDKLADQKTLNSYINYYEKNY